MYLEVHMSSYNQPRIVERHAMEAEARIQSYLKAGWVVTHDNGATCTMAKDGALEVIIHRCYYTHWAALTR